MSNTITTTYEIDGIIFDVSYEKDSSEIKLSWGNWLKEKTFSFTGIDNKTLYTLFADSINDILWYEKVNKYGDSLDWYNSLMQSIGLPWMTIGNCVSALPENTPADSSVDNNTQPKTIKKRKPKWEDIFKEWDWEKNNWNLLSLSKHWPIEFLLDKETLKVMYDVNWERGFIDKPNMDKIKNELKKANRFYLSTKQHIAQQDVWYKLWDRVIMYWPTWSGKTHNAYAWIMQNKIPFVSINVTDWFEDIDFLTYIIPTDNGIRYKEKDVVGLLRLASQWEKVAILIDEINRWSKSFLNLVLKLLDPVTGSYELDNFVNDEKIIIPRDNIIFFCTANFWSSYVGTEQMDEALFDRFSVVNYVDYNQDLENTIIDNFWEHKEEVKEIIKLIRDMNKDNTVKRPMSTRTIKTRAEAYMNTSKTKEDVFKSFESTVLYRLVSPDAYGLVSEYQLQPIVSLMIKKGFVTKK